MKKSDLGSDTNMRAIYTGDILYNVCHVFEYDQTTKLFHMISDRELNYPFDLVMNDTDWIVFLTDGENVYQVNVLAPKES